MKKKRNASQQGKASRDKGKRAELQLAHIWQDAGYKDAKRAVQHSGRGNGRGDLIGIPRINCESKAVERLNVRTAYEQAVDNAEGTNELPVVCHKKDRKPWLVTLSLEDFIKIFRCYAPPEGSEN